MISSYQADLEKKSFGLIKPHYPLAPYWTSELYSKGKYLREYGRYPFFLPLCVYCSHGVGEYESPQLHELGSDAPAQLFFSKNTLDKWKKITTKPAYLIITPEIYYRRSRGIIKNKDARGSIYFTAHSTPSIEDLLDHEKLIKTIRKIPIKYQPVDVCLHSHDIKKGLHLEYLNAGIKVVTAGDTLDYRFIKRFYEIIRKYQFAMSNDIGSYLFYSIEMGIPFSLIGPEPILINVLDKNYQKGKIENDWGSPELRKIKKIFKGYHSKITSKQLEHVENKLGINTTISRFELSIILYRSLLYWIISPKKVFSFLKRLTLILFNKIKFFKD